MDKQSIFRELPMLDVQHLSMKFTTKKRGRTSTVKAVDDVSFSIYKGETFGLVGESGCGKTTTGRSIIRLYNYQEGDVTFDGRSISGKLTKELRRYITDNIANELQSPLRLPHVLWHRTGFRLCKGKGSLRSPHQPT